MTPISGPQDVGGACPTSTFKLLNHCVCNMNLCRWSQCPDSSPPLECLQDVPNATWIYHQGGYFEAFIIEWIV